MVYSVPVAKAGPLDNLFGARRGRRRRAAPGDPSTSEVKEWVPSRLLRMCIDIQAPPGSEAGPGGTAEGTDSGAAAPDT